MKKCVLSVIGSRRLHELRRGDLVDVVRGVAQRDKIEMAHRFGERIRAIFDSAVDPGASRPTIQRPRRSLGGLTPASCAK